MSSTCKPAISTSTTLNQTMPLRFFASSRTLYSLENTRPSKQSLTVGRSCNAVTAKKSYHRFFHLKNNSRYFSLRANDIARNRSRVIFSRACADIFRRWSARAEVTLYVTGEGYIHFYCTSSQLVFCTVCMHALRFNMTDREREVVKMGKETCATGRVGGCLAGNSDWSIKRPMFFHDNIIKFIT